MSYCDRWRSDPFRWIVIAALLVGLVPVPLANGQGLPPVTTQDQSLTEACSCQPT